MFYMIIIVVYFPMYDPKYDWQALYKTRKVSSSIVYFYEFFFIVLLFSGCEFFIINFLLLLEHFQWRTSTQKPLPIQIKPIHQKK